MYYFSSSMDIRNYVVIYFIYTPNCLGFFFANFESPAFAGFHEGVTSQWLSSHRSVTFLCRIGWLFGYLLHFLCVPASVGNACLPWNT